MIMPFLIDRAVNINSLKENFINYIQTSCNLRKNQVVDKLRYLWVLFTKLVALIFRKAYSETEFKSLNKLIIQWANTVSKV